MSRLGCCMLALLAGACARGEPRLTALHSEAITDSVRQMLNRFVEVANQAQPTALLKFYADDPTFHWAEEGTIRYPSYQAMATTFDSLQRTVRGINLVVDQPRVNPLRPGLAVVSASWREAITDTAGAVLRLAGAFTAIVSHRDSGWQFLAGHSSTARDLAAPPPPRR